LGAKRIPVCIPNETITPLMIKRLRAERFSE
jgi:hypothetical protein